MATIAQRSQLKFKFKPGQIVSTHGALDLMKEHNVNPATLLQRHLTGDWGDLTDNDKAENDKGCADNDCPNGDPNKRLRIFSSYILNKETEEKVWIITEASRESTTLLLPEEY